MTNIRRLPRSGPLRPTMIGAILVLTGCSSGPTRPEAGIEVNPVVHRAVPRGPVGSAHQSKLDQIAAALEAERQKPAAGGTTDAPIDPTIDEAPSVRVPTSEATLSTGATDLSIDDPPAVAPTMNEASAWQATPAEAQSRAAHELAAILRARIAEAEDVPLDLLMRLAALDAIEPGVLNSYFLGDNGRPPTAQLTEDEMAFLIRWRDLLEETRGEAGEADAQGIGALIDLVDAAAGDLAELGDVRIRRALLCRRVETIGRYEEMNRYGDTYRIVASLSRGHRMIVYVEPTHFSNRATTVRGIEGYSVELAQDLLLYRLDEASDMLAWQLLDQAVTEFSRVRRRDFFLTCVVTLPPTLSVGKYRLKVVLRDVNAGAVAEENINLEVVGNEGALGG